MSKKAPIKQRAQAFFTPLEERWNSWSHAAGILMGLLVGGALLYWCGRIGNGWATVGVVLYLIGMLASYICSTLYHALPTESQLKQRLRHWDHAAIYWHIAGSYSPITLIAMRSQGYWGWALFAFVWLCAIVGTVFSFLKLKKHSHLETLCFVGMGLSVLVAFKPLIDCVPTSAVVWIVAEGVAYITGAVFYSLNKQRYMHTVFHFFVLLGSLCHIVAVWGILLEQLP